MESVFKRTMLILLPEKCYDEFFINFNLFHVICLKTLLSKCLGFAIIAGSSIVKVPQIVKILNGQSAQGVSLINVLTDLYAITAASCYCYVSKFPFSAYGEGILLGAQTLAIAALVLHYNFSYQKAAIFTVVYSYLTYYLSSGFVPINILWSLQASTVPLMFFGKMVQAYTNYKNGGTGQLSMMTCVMLLFGSLSRVFTSIQETGDTIIIITYSLATLGNAIIVYQFIHYKHSEEMKETENKMK